MNQMKEKPEKPKPSSVASLPKNPKLRAIATAFSLDVPQLVHDAENEILEAWAQAEDEAQLNDTNAKFALSFAVSLDLEKDKMETKLSFSVRHSRSIDRAIPDPNQPELPVGDAGDITISGEGISATMAADQFSKVAKNIVKASKGRAA